MTTVDPKVYQALVIAKALKLYADTGIKANHAYTPTNMLRMATQITGQKFKRGQYMEAHDAIWSAILRMESLS